MSLFLLIFINIIISESEQNLCLHYLLLASEVRASVQHEHLLMDGPIVMAV